MLDLAALDFTSKQDSLDRQVAQQPLFFLTSRRTAAIHG
jgi:hypothetical protein